jgi:hypothetical protein
MPPCSLPSHTPTLGLTPRDHGEHGKEEAWHRRQQDQIGRKRRRRLSGLPDSGDSTYNQNITGPGNVRRWESNRWITPPTHR